MEVSHSNISVFEHNNSDSSLCEYMSPKSTEAILACLVIILILCILGNGAVCVIVSRHYQLHTVTNAYFVNMAIIQLLFTLFSIPPYLRISSSSAGKTQWLCVFIGFSFQLFAALSNLALTLLTIERYYVINNSGRKKISAKATGKLISAASILALIFAVLWTLLEGSSTNCSTASDFGGSSLACFSLLSSHKTATLRILNIVYILVCFLLPMALMAALFVKMTKPLWSGFHGIRPMGTGNTGTIRFFAEIKTTRTLFIISVLHLCCWLPLCITSLYLSSRLKQNDRHLSFLRAKIVSICLAFASSCINPLMYALRNPRFSIIFRPNTRSHGKKRVHFKKTAEKGENTSTKPMTWVQRTKCASIYDTSRSEETQTTSSC